jgi:hypothetical protein
MKRLHWWLAALASLALLAAACTNKAANRDAGGSTQTLTSEPAAPKAAAAPDTAESQANRTAASAGSGASPAVPTDSTAAQAPLADRKLVINVSLDLVMEDVQAGFERIGQIAEAAGGFVADANIRRQGDARQANITVRVPADRHQEALSQIRGLAVKVESETAKANDVTEEYTDLESRQRNLEATEQQLLVLLGQAKNVQEVLTVQDRLNSTRAEIEKVKGRIALLSRLTEMATIQAQLRPEPAVAKTPASEDGPLHALRTGWDASVELVGRAALALLTAAAFSWWLLPIALFAAWLVRREIRRRATPPAPAGEGTAP